LIRSDWEFHLFVDDPEAVGSVASMPPAGRIAILPGCTSFLVISGSGAMLGDRTAAVAALEPVRHDGQTYLALTALGGCSTRINGSPAPRPAVLRPGDRVVFEPDVALTVMLYRRPYVGPPDTEHVGQVCPLCRVAIAPETTIALCPACGAALHCEGEDVEAENRLECARLGSGCPRCGAALSLVEGYAHVEDL
jgi:hypothetical protein